MRTSSKMARFPPQTVKNNLEKLALGQRRYKQHSSSPYSSKHSFHIRQYLPYHHSGPQLEKQGNLKLKIQRERHLSALLEPQKLGKTKIKEEVEQVDSSLGYIAQIAAMQKKRKIRLSFLKKKENFQQSYQIGILPKKAQEQKDSKDTAGKEGQSEQTQPSYPLNSPKTISELVSVEEMHYEMVLVHQKAKKMTKN